MNGLVGKSDSDDDIHDGVHDGDWAAGDGCFPCLSDADDIRLFNAGDGEVIGGDLDMSHHFRKSLVDCS